MQVLLCAVWASVKDLIWLLNPKPNIEHMRTHIAHIVVDREIHKTVD